MLPWDGWPINFKSFYNHFTVLSKGFYNISSHSMSCLLFVNFLNHFGPIGLVLHLPFLWPLKCNQCGLYSSGARNLTKHVRRDQGWGRPSVALKSRPAFQNIAKVLQQEPQSLRRAREPSAVPQQRQRTSCSSGRPALLLLLHLGFPQLSSTSWHDTVKAARSVPWDMILIRF